MTSWYSPKYGAWNAAFESSIGCHMATLYIAPKLGKWLPRGLTAGTWQVSESAHARIPSVSRWYVSVKSWRLYFPYLSLKKAHAFLTPACEWLCLELMDWIMPNEWVWARPHYQMYERCEDELSFKTGWFKPFTTCIVGLSLIQIFSGQSTRYWWPYGWQWRVSR